VWKTQKSEVQNRHPGHPTVDDEDGASSAGGLAPSIISHSMNAISPKAAC